MVHIVVVGSINADVVVDVERLPQRGETIAARLDNTGVVYPGGKGANQAAAAASLLGGNGKDQCSLVGQLGKDAHAVTLQEALHCAGVRTDHVVQREDCASGQAFVFIYPDGDNSIVIAGGANAIWPTALPSEVQELIGTAAMVMLQCEIPAAVNEMVVQCAAAAGVPVLHDVGGQERAFDAKLLQQITIIAPNETELARMVGQPVRTLEDAVEGAKWLQCQRGAQNVLVTLGSMGAVFVPRNKAEPHVHHPCFPVTQVVDTTGAGDCYRSAFAVCYAQGHPIARCMQYAAAASALCIQERGAMPSMPSAERVDEFLRKLES